MKLIFITYSDCFYDRCKAILLASVKASNQWDDVWSYNRQWLEGTIFYKDNKNILDEKIGGGYWLWKPYIILDTLNQCNENDIIFYLDAGDEIKGNIRNFLIKRMENIDILLEDGKYNQSQWTKRDCFKKMNCDNGHYWNVRQLEAGSIAVKKTEQSIKIIKEWLEWCRDYEIISDSPSKDNFPEFIKHRHDQSILTNLKVKYNLESSLDLHGFIINNVCKP